MDKPLVIIGAGGLGREVAWYLQDINQSVKKGWNLIGFLDDKGQGATIEGYSILGEIQALYKMKSDVWVCVAIGDHQVRQKIMEKIISDGYNLATIIHPSARISPFVKIENGCVIAPNSVITTNVIIGKGTIMGIGSLIGHDTVLGDYCSLMQGVNIAGEVDIGNEVYFGSNATIINRIKIGNGTIVGAGAVVTNDLPAYVTAVGVPAKIIKQR